VFTARYGINSHAPVGIINIVVPLTGPVRSQDSVSAMCDNDNDYSASRPLSVPFHHYCLLIPVLQLA
jgi:hypothetical protein